MSGKPIHDQGFLFETGHSLPLPKVKPGMTLGEARTLLAEQAVEGVECPCCGQFAKVYRRKLNSGMARSLIWLVKEFLETKDGVEVQKQAPRQVMANREMGKLVHFGLAVIKGHDGDSKKKTSGLWRPTDKGIDFVFDRVRVPRRVYLYDNKAVGSDDEMTSIREALGDKFDYGELMGGMPGWSGWPR
jgi:hypothetical protein